MLCTFHIFDEYYHCDWVGQPQTVPARESLTLTCPEESNFPVTPPSEGDGTSPVSIKIGRTCPYAVTQMGCSRYETCTVHGYASTRPEFLTTYPWLATFKVKVVGAGSGWTRAHWSVSFANTDSGGPMSYDQRRGEWLEITPEPRADTGLISIVVDCKTTEEIQVKVINECILPVILGIPEAGEWITLQSNNERDFYLEKDNPTATLTPLNGQLLCVHNDRTAANYCNYETIYLSDMLDQDVIRIPCPKDYPLPVDTSGQSIQLSVRTPATTTFNFAMQIGCVPENPCSPVYSLEGGSQSGIPLYPVTSPATRLRVRAFPAPMFHAEWSVQFSDGPVTTLIQPNAQWLDIDVPSDATSITLYGDAFDGPPPEPVTLSVINACDNAAEALISVPRESDLLIAPSLDEVGLRPGMIYSDDPQIFFTSLTGRQMCAVVERTGSGSCGIDGIVASGLMDSDIVRLECPDDGPPLPVSDNIMPVIIITDQTSPNLVVQFGCETEGGDCFSYAAGRNANRDLKYPVLEPMLRFRVRIYAEIGYGEALSYVKWQVKVFTLAEQIYYRQKGEWLEVYIPPSVLITSDDGSSIIIKGFGFESGSSPEAGTVD
jgi:hypothetical protein